MSHHPPRRPGRPPTGSEDKRERVLREAFGLFARRGYAATSLTDVARAADISKAGLLHHFGSKDALFTAVLERRDARDRPQGEDDVDVWALLEEWVRLVGRNASRPGIVGLYSAMAGAAATPGHPAHPWLHRHFERAVGPLTDAFERGKAAGTVAMDAPSRELARTVAAVSDGVQLQWLCARADTDDGGAVPEHGGVPLDMAAQMRLVVDLIRSRWGIPAS